MRILFLVLLSLSSGCLAERWISHDFEVMGTRAGVTFLVTDQTSPAEQVTGEVETEMRRLESLLSPYIATSELSQLNARAAKEPVTVSNELLQLLQHSQRISELSEGAFDVTYASVGYLYDYRQRRRPSAQQIEYGLVGIDFRAIQLDLPNSKVSFSKPQVKIDLGGIAKGYAVDRCIDLLQTMGVTNAHVYAGGDARILGDRDGKPWFIGVKSPRASKESAHGGSEQSSFALTLPVADVAVSTSGDYERFFMDGTERVHHIIDPTSGYPSKKSQSVTILADEAMISDALSTAVFVLGWQKGLELINGLPEVSAIVIDETGQLHFSSDLEPVK